MSRTDRRRRRLIAVVLAAALAIGCTAAGHAARAAAGGDARGAAASRSPQLGAQAAILVDPDTGQQLYARRPDQQMAIASTTKLMTVLVVLEHAPLSRVFADPNYYPAAQDSQIGLAPGERMTVKDLILAALLPSADDAAEDLAYNLGHRSVGRFIDMMNVDARRLGLRHTHYSTPIGLDTPGNYSTAADLVKLTAFVLAHQPFVRRAVGLRSAVLRSGSHVRAVVNRNDLVARFPWIHGVKTGHTLQAGYVLVGLARRRGMTLLSAVLGTSSEAERDQDTLSLLGFGFDRFHQVKVVRAGQVVAREPVSDQPGKFAEVAAAHSLTRVFARGERVSTRTSLPSQLSGPRARGAVVGSLSVLAGGRAVARVPLVLVAAIPAVSTLTRATRALVSPFTLGVLLVAVIAAGSVLVSRRLRLRAVTHEGG